MTEASDDSLQGRAARGLRTRERILEVAEELIAKNGVNGLELKEVAARVGIRSPSIFAHFKGRDDLADAVARRVGRAIVATIAIKGDCPEQVLREAVRNLVAHLAAHPAHVRILLADLVRQREGHHRPGSAEHLRRAESYVQVLLDAGVSKGTFRPVRVDSCISFMLGGILSTLSWYGWDEEGNLQGPLTLQQIQRDIEEILVGYLLTRPET